MGKIEVELLRVLRVEFLGVVRSFIPGVLLVVLASEPQGRKNLVNASPNSQWIMLRNPCSLRVLELRRVDSPPPGR